MHFILLLSQTLGRDMMEFTQSRTNGEIFTSMFVLILLCFVMDISQALDNDASSKMDDQTPEAHFKNDVGPTKIPDPKRITTEGNVNLTMNLPKTDLPLWFVWSIVAPGMQFTSAYVKFHHIFIGTGNMNNCNLFNLTFYEEFDPEHPGENKPIKQFCSSEKNVTIKSGKTVLFAVVRLGHGLKRTPTLNGTIEHVYGPDHACSLDGRKQLTISKPGTLVYKCFKGNPTYENYTCNWIIQAPEGYVISINNILCYGCGERNDMKVYDYKIGPNNVLPFKYRTDEFEPDPIYSSANTLYVTANLTYHWKYGFCDNREIGFIYIYGFHFNFTQLNQKACNSVKMPFQLPFSIGGFSSPGFPTDVPQKPNCKWLIYAGPKHQLFVQFYTLYFENAGKKSNHMLIIYDGKTEHDPILAKLEGLYDEMPFFASNSSYLLMVFVNTRNGNGHLASNLNNEMKSEWGFRLRFNITENTKNSLACSNKRPHILTEKKGKITIPRYAVWFGSFRATPKCEWIVQAPNGYVVNIKTMYMDGCDCGPPDNPTARKYICHLCRGQSLYMGNNASQVSKKYIGHYCCLKRGQIIKTGAPVFFFDLSTSIHPSGIYPDDKSYEYNTNFSLEYEMKSALDLACINPGYVNLSVDGVIEVPAQKNKQDHMELCQWNLIGNPDEVITLYIDELNIDCNCSKASFKIFRGSTPESQLVFETCCNLSKKEIHVENDTLTIVLNQTTNTKSNGKLLQAHYEFIPRTDIACNNESRPYNATVSPGVISSPGYRDGSTAWADLPTGLNCQWLIKAPPGELIKLHVSFILGFVSPGNDCYNNGCTTIYDGSSLEAPVKYVTFEYPSDYTSKTRFILIQFVTKSRKGIWDYSGFNLSYEFISRKTWVEKYWYIFLAAVAVVFAMILLYILSIVFKRKSGESVLNVPGESDDQADDQPIVTDDVNINGH